MIEEQRRILNMMADGKLNAVEAEALLEALSSNQLPGAAPGSAQPPTPKASPRYLRILVEGRHEAKSNKVNVRVPLELIRAGMRLAVLIPTVAYESVNRAFKANGVDVDISKVKPEDLEGLVAHLQELEIDVDDGDEKVRVFCE